MAGVRTIALEEARTAVALQAECHDLPPQHDCRANHIAQRLAGWFDASLVMIGIIEFRPEDARPHIARISGGFSRLDSRSQRIIDEYMRDPHTLPDPWWYRAWSRIRRANQCTAVTRRDVVPDREWYSSPMVQRYRKPAKIDSCMGCALPSAISRQWLAVSLHKPWGAPEFRARDRDLLCLAVEHLGWLDRLRLREAEASAIYESLPPRLKRTLDALLAGKSEKQTARALNLSVHTVHDYVKELHRRLDVSSRVELVNRCRDLGLTRTLPPPRPGAINPALS